MADLLQLDYIQNVGALLHHVSSSHFTTSLDIYAVTHNETLRAARLFCDTMDLNVSSTN